MPDPTPQNTEPVVTEPVTQAEPVAQATPAPEYASRSDFERLERMLTAMASAVASQPQAPAAPQNPSQVTDDQLYDLATKGNRPALDEYVGRIAERKAGGFQSQNQRQQAVMGQLAVLYQKYPELADAQNPLTQKALAFRQALFGMGEPNTRETELNAILRAVADSRDLIAKPVGQPRQSQPGQFPSTPRQQAAPAETAEVVTPQEHTLAKQFGVRDAGAAKKKFWERNGKGISSVSPNIAAALQMQKEGQ